MIQDVALALFNLAAGLSGLAVGSNSVVVYVSYLNLVVGSCVLLYSLAKLARQGRERLVHP